MKGYSVDGKLRMIASLYFLISVFFLLPHWAIGQSYSVRHFGIPQGLPTSQINSLLKDELGYLWIGTHGGGLVRFDGNEFITYTTRDGLVNNYITKICQDSENNIWIGTLLGLSAFDGVSFRSIDLNLDREPTPKQRMIKQVISTQDHVYVLNYCGQIGRVEAEKIEWINNREPANFIAMDSNYVLFYHNHNNELVNLGDESAKIRLPDGLEMEGITLGSGRKMINTNKGLFRIQGKSFVREFENYDSGPLLVNSREGIIWDLKDQLLQLKVGPNIQEVHRYPEIFQITTCLQDENDEVWIGSYTQGLFNIKKRSMEKIFSVERNDVVTAIEQVPDKSFWFGAFGNGVLKYDHQSKRKTRFHFDDDNRKNFVTVLRQHRTRIWIGTYGGLGVYENNKISWLKDDQNGPIDSVLSLDVDSSDRIWIGRADRGIERIEGDEIYHIPFPGKAALAIKYVDSDSILYIGTFQGIYTYRNGEVRKLHIKSMQEGLVRSLDVFRNKYLVIASENNGVLFYNIKNGSVSSVSIEDGILSPLLNFVKVEGDYVWIGTIKGINRIKLDDNMNVIDVQCFNDKNGFDGIETNSNSIFLSDSLKLFGSSDGVYKFNDVNPSKTKTGRLHLQDVKLFYGARNSRSFSDSVSGFFKIPHSPEFKASDNHVTFGFNAVNTGLPGPSTYTYRLDGFDQQWSQHSGRNEVTYSSLPPGNYIFRIRLNDSKSRDVIKDLSYPFSIAPPFYQETWFVAFMVVLTVVTVVVVFRSQVQRRVHRMIELAKARAEENHRLRQDIARDFHDEMGNHLVIVSSHVNLLLMESNDPGKIEVLQRIESSIRYINLRTRDFIWSINPSHNNLDDLFLYLRDFAEGLYKNSNIIFRAENNVSETHQVTYKFSKETILIFKEIFTNALKHSKAMNVYFRLTMKEYRFAMEVSDDGVGIVNKDWANGGLSNMTFRANKIGAGLTFSSPETGGTCIGLNFILKETKSIRHEFSIN